MSKITILCLFMWILAVPTFALHANNQQDTTIETVDDEFGEFKVFDADAEFDSVDTTAGCGTKPSCAGCPHSKAQVEETPIFASSFWWILGILGATILAGFLVRNPVTRKLRIPFLLASIVFLGFYRGPCPCMISSFENTILLFAGVEFHWTNLVWFLGLLPITYLFGRVFCGWICHLGALQEFLYRPGRWSILKDEKSIRIMKTIQYSLFAVLVIQLLVQQKIFWCSINPFLSIYQLMLAYNYEILSAVLVGLLLVTSLISYRPFCRAVCPVGLVLGWIEKIPGASVLGMKGSCISCTQCSNACNVKAIYRKEKESILNNEECIMCGECLDACKKSSLGFFRLSKKNPSKIVCDSSSWKVDSEKITK